LGGLALSDREFDRLFIESVDETLDALLGEKVRIAVCDILENRYHIAMDQAPARLDDFALGLEKVLGAASNSTIRKIIIKRFYVKLGLEGLELIERANWRLPDYVREARTKMSQRSEPVE